MQRKWLSSGLSFWATVIFCIGMVGNIDNILIETYSKVRQDVKCKFKIFKLQSNNSWLPR